MKHHQEETRDTTSGSTEVDNEAMEILDGAMDRTVAVSEFF